MNKNKLKKLLEDTPEKWYWLGFLMADGHFSKSNRLRVKLAIKDLEHIKTLASFLEVKWDIEIRNGYEYGRVSVMDTVTLRILKEQFNINSNKTINPPDLSSLNEEQLFCFSVGFIDGDGCIGFQSGRNDVILRVKCHSAWADNIFIMFGDCKINNQGYAQVSISDNTILRKIKRKVNNFNLPILKRKWDKIDLERVSKYEVTKERINIIRERLKEGMKKIEIAKELGIHPSAISNLIRRNKINVDILR